MQPSGRFDALLLVSQASKPQPRNAPYSQRPKQIISLQSLHYVTLSVILPPLLVLCTDPIPLTYHHGGPATVGMVMDWREMAGRPTSGPGVGDGSWNPFASSWDGVVRVPDSQHKGGIGGWKTGAMGDASSSPEALSAWHASADALDPKRAWTIALSWFLACAAE